MLDDMRSFAIVYWLWILVRLTGRPFSIRQGQRLLLICISLSSQASSMSFQTQAGWGSSSLFGIISVLRILHNPGWCSILLYHVTFFVDRGGPFSILPGSDVQASDSRPFCGADVDKYWVQFQSAEWGRDRGPRAISSTAVPLGTCGHLSQPLKGVSELPSPFIPWKWPCRAQGFAERNLDSSRLVAFCC